MAHEEEISMVFKIHILILHSEHGTLTDLLGRKGPCAKI